MGNLPCGHLILRVGCRHCQQLKNSWYERLEEDPEWKDIEYGLESPMQLYDPAANTSFEPLTTDFYDKVFEVYHLWVKARRSKRDCLVAELYATQQGVNGTERGISAVLKSKKLKPSSKSEVRETIKEIKTLVLKKDQRHLCVEESVIALRPLDSKPQKDEANGKTGQDSAGTRRAA